jgi:hypothetical protein
MERNRKMAAYLVRLQETMEIVWLIAASDKASLWDQADEVCDPGVCGYIAIGNGGRMFHEQGAPACRPYSKPKGSDEDAEWDQSWETSSPG